MNEDKNIKGTLLSKMINYGLDIKECIFLLNFINNPKFEIYKKIINSVNNNEVYIENPIATNKFERQDFYIESTETPNIVSVDGGATWIDLSIYTKLHNLWYCLNYVTCGTFSKFFTNMSFKKIEFPYKVETDGNV